MAEERLDGALQASEHALRFFPGEDTYRRNHTVALMLVGQQCGEARAHEFAPVLRDAMAFRAGDPAFAELLPMLVDLDTAQAAIEEARRLQPDDIAIEEYHVALLCDVALQRIQRGQFDEAEALLTPLLDQIDTYPVVGNHMARVLTPASSPTRPTCSKPTPTPPASCSSVPAPTLPTSCS